MQNNNNFEYIKIASNNKSVKLVFMFHGFAQRASHMANILGKKFSETLPQLCIYSLNGLHECKGFEGKRRYDWLSYDENWSINSIQKSIKNTSDVINNFINDKLKEHNLSNKDLALVGFSQGARVALHVGLTRNEACAGILGYSGALSLPQYLAKQVQAKPEVMLIHGDEDKILPCEESINAAEILNNLDVQTSVKIITDLEHKINERGVDIGTEFLKRIFKL